ncbi:MAG: glyceraldehyde 3-phosphate dehydrogenase NAD-binding domain-containing protein, partial [Patescibacteria group bacterium]
MARIAINGFGRIGRLFFRQAFGNKKLDIVAINDLGDCENLAYLLKYDTVYGRFDEEVSTTDGYLVVGKKEIKFLQERDPTKLPWKDLKVDVAVESTGIFESFEAASVHLKAGAKRVVITAPAKDEERADAKTVLMGVNEEQFKVCKITSNGSCTTNATHPVAAIMAETVGIKKAVLSTVHGYTATQNLVDGPTKGKDYRR